MKNNQSESQFTANIMDTVDDKSNANCHAPTDDTIRETCRKSTDGHNNESCRQSADDKINESIQMPADNSHNPDNQSSYEGLAADITSFPPSFLSAESDAGLHINVQQLYQDICTAHRMANTSSVLEKTACLLNLKNNPAYASYFPSPFVGDAVLKASYASYREGNIPQAQHDLNQALHMFKEISDQPGILRCISQAASIARFLNNPREAMDWCSQAENLDLQTIRESDPAAAAEFYRIQAWSRHDQGDRPAARKDLDLALNLIETSGDRISNQTRGEVLYTNGLFLYQTGKYQPALDALQDALLSFEKEFGDESVELCNSLNQLGFCFQKLNQTDQAIGCFERSYSIRKKAYGEKNLLTSISCGNLLSQQLQQNPLNPDLESRIQQLINTREELCKTSRNPVWLARAWNLAGTYYQKNRNWPESRKRFLTAASLFLGNSQTKEYGLSLKEAAKAIEMEEGFEAALPVYLQAQDLITQYFSPAHPATIEIRNLVSNGFTLKSDQ